jgi:hypothetical protein
VRRQSTSLTPFKIDFRETDFIFHVIAVSIFDSGG